MKNPQPDPAGPRIDIHLGRDGVDIRQRRPAIARALVGLPVEAALARIPTLLPICGAAQAVAATRAVAAARGQAQAHHDTNADRDLWQEQALASAWRLTVDWPDLLGEAHRMDALKRVYQAVNESERSAALQQLTAGLEAIASLAELWHWVGDSDSVAARVIRLAQAAGPDDSLPAAPAPLLEPDGWCVAASAALACEPFDALDPKGSPLEVGPLAMGRDPLSRELQATMGSTVVSRLLAQLLDARVIARALEGIPARVNGHSDADSGALANAWPLAASDGVGCAVTARGPVFHRVVLAGATAGAADVTVADWRVLAPTDWHFSPRGPVAARLAARTEPTRQRIALLVTSYDPCAPWGLHSPGHPVPEGG